MLSFKKRPRVERGGAVLVAVLVCLLVSTAIVATTMTGTLARRTQLRREIAARQADLVLVGACDRARYRVVNESDYTGESWRPDAPKLTDELTPLVEIVVKDRSTESAVLSVDVTLDSAGPFRVSRSTSFTVSLAEEQAKPNEVSS